MNKGNSKYQCYFVIFIILWNLISCGILKKDDAVDKPLTEAEMMKKLHKEERKQLKIARKASEKAKKDFWSRQTPEVKRRIKETYKRDKKARKLAKKHNSKNKGYQNW
ncbi:MAG: hypothetical protein ACK48V_10755 [Crocinitomicaceae bacterium]|jgi:hypothetical protein